MPGIKEIGSRFDVFKDLALTTKSGLLKEDLVWYNNCVITNKEHTKELQKEEQQNKMLEKHKMRKIRWDEILNAKGPFIRPKIRVIKSQPSDLKI